MATIYDFVDTLTEGGSAEARKALSGIEDDGFVDEHSGEFVPGRYDRILKQYYPGAKRINKGTYAGKYLIRREDGKRAFFDPPGYDEGDWTDLTQLGQETLWGGIGTLAGIPLGPWGATATGLGGTEVGRQIHQAETEAALPIPEERTVGDRLIGNLPSIFTEGAVGFGTELLSNAARPVRGIVKPLIQKIAGKRNVGQLRDTIGTAQELNQILTDRRGQMVSPNQNQIGILDPEGRANLPTYGTASGSKGAMTMEGILDRSMFGTDPMRRSYEDWYRTGENINRELATPETRLLDNQLRSASATAPIQGQTEVDNFFGSAMNDINENPWDVVFTDKNTLYEENALAGIAKNDIGINSQTMDTFTELTRVEPPNLPEQGFIREKGEIGDNIIKHGLEQFDARNERIGEHLYNVAEELTGGFNSSLQNTEAFFNQVGRRGLLDPTLGGSVNNQVGQFSGILDDYLIREWETPWGPDLGTRKDMLLKLESQGMAMNPSLLTPGATQKTGPHYSMDLSDLKELRTHVREEWKRSSDNPSLRDKSLDNLYNALTQDIIDGSKTAFYDEAGNLTIDEAGAKAWQTANDFWANAKSFKDDDTKKFIDSIKNAINGEAAFNKALSGTKEGIGNFDKLLKALPTEHTEALKGSIIWDLGWNNNQWSPRTFLSRTGHEQMSGKMKDILFGALGSDKRTAFENYRKLLETVKVSDGFMNWSGTTSGNIMGQAMTSILSGGAFGGIGTGVADGVIWDTTGALVGAGVGLGVYAYGSRALANLMQSNKFMQYMAENMPRIRRGNMDAWNNFRGQLYAKFADDPNIGPLLDEALNYAYSSFEDPDLTVPQSEDIGDLVTRERRSQMDPSNFVGIGQIAP